jgi:hypothetical protein
MQPFGCSEREGARAKVPRFIESLIATGVSRIAFRLPVNHIERYRFRLDGRLPTAFSASRTDDCEAANQYLKQSHFLLQKDGPR